MAELHSPRTASSRGAHLERLLAEGLGASPGLGGEGPLVVFVRIPSWLGNRGRHPENCEAPLDLGYGAALARTQGFRATIVDLETGAFAVGRVEGALGAAAPAAVFLSAITPAADVSLRLGRSIKEASPETLVVACGHHADAVPESFLFEGSPVDLCVAGELEATLPDLLAALARGDPPAVAGTIRLHGGRLRKGGDRAPVEDLDALPRPAHELFLSRSYRHLHPMQALGPFRWGFIQGSRGCPFRCIYCSKSLRTSFGSRYRLRSPSSIVEEMRFLADRGRNVLVFTDDVFNSTKERVHRLCDRITSSGVRLGWKAQGRAAPADREMFLAMRRAGCSTFSIGVESGSPRVLERLQKQTTVEDVERAFRLAREAGLLRVAFLMVGCPGETEADFLMTMALMERIDPDMVQVAFFTPYPGSVAYDRHGSGEVGSWAAFQHYESCVNVTPEPVATVRGWQRRLYRRFIARPRYLARYLRLKHVNLLLNFRDERFLVEQAVRSVLLPS